MTKPEFEQSLKEVHVRITGRLPDEETFDTEWDILESIQSIVRPLTNSEYTDWINLQYGRKENQQNRPWN